MSAEAAPSLRWILIAEGSGVSVCFVNINTKSFKTVGHTGWPTVFILFLIVTAEVRYKTEDKEIIVKMDTTEDKLF